MYLNVDRQGCVIKTVAYSLRTDTHTQIDKSLKTEGPKIMPNYIFYFMTVIIGGPTVMILKEKYKVKVDCTLIQIQTPLCDFSWTE